MGSDDEISLRAKKRRKRKSKSSRALALSSTDLRKHKRKSKSIEDENPLVASNSRYRSSINITDMTSSAPAGSISTRTLSAPRAISEDDSTIKVRKKTFRKSMSTTKSEHLPSSPFSPRSESTDKT